ncbi:leucine-rich repeat domain-containing protein [Mycoplasmatota bacterium]|nr:leucine-rich repeat domain-containing protein [Mycoplasmatota bacterium]
MNKLTNLTNLNLGYNQVSDLTVLSGLINLTELNLVRNQINDITALSNLTNLRELSLHYNQISDLNALKNLINLTFLNIENNSISNLNILRTMFDNGAFTSKEHDYQIILDIKTLDISEGSDAYNTLIYLIENDVSIDFNPSIIIKRSKCD